MLTALLRDRQDVADRLARLAKPFLPPVNYAPIIAPARTSNYSLVGTAFDYLLRWEIQRRNPVAVDREWVAELALRLLDSPIEGFDPELVSLYRSVVSEAATFVRNDFIPSHPNPGAAVPYDIGRAIRCALTLAKVDPLFRSGTIDPSVHEYDPLDVDDLTDLWAVAPWESLVGDAENIPLLNPEFGSISKTFRGADADLIVGETLIDFKTSKYFGVERHTPQLVGYAMIADAYRETEDPSFPEIRKAGIYFCRHGVLSFFDFDEVRSAPDYNGARGALFDAAVEAFGDVRVVTNARPLSDGGDGDSVPRENASQGGVRSSPDPPSGPFGPNEV